MVAFLSANNQHQCMAPEQWLYTVTREQSGMIFVQETAELLLKAFLRI